MPQNGFHGLGGLLAARSLASAPPQEFAAAFVPSVVFGAILPDADMYPASIAELLGRGELFYEIHRTATHGLSLILVLFILGALLRRCAVGWVLLGLAIGITTHAVLDLFLWFTQVDLLWPLTKMDGTSVPVVNLWAGVNLPTLVGNGLAAAEFAALALYTRALAGIMKSCGGTAKGMPGWEYAMWAFFIITLITAVLFRDTGSIQEYIVFTPYLLVFLPYTWIKTWHLRKDIAEWAVRRPDKAQTAVPR